MYEVAQMMALGLEKEVNGRTADALSSLDDDACPGPQPCFR